MFSFKNNNENTEKKIKTLCEIVEHNIIMILYFIFYLCNALGFLKYDKKISNTQIGVKTKKQEKRV